MQHAVLNRATLQVADTRDVSGRVTAKSVKDGFCAKKQSDLSRICALAIFGSVVLLGPVLARAQGIPREIEELKAQVAALQSQVHALQTQLAAVQSNNALKLGPFVTVDPNPKNGVRGPNITFKGANIHIVSGSGATDDNLSHGGTLIGLGNLIIGYDELLNGQVANRSGSHNLVIGRFHTFTSSAWGGLVGGEQNTIQAANATVSGGSGNTVSGDLGSVSGGEFNTASGDESSVSGGFSNLASGGFASVSGGFSNLANGSLAAINGGFANIASGEESSVSGGFANTAGGLQTVVIGGFANTDNKTQSIAPQPPFP